uniref:Putative product n=1 Tax=Xenopsylla cheopis TaxID=163159 RepID=A0A6M2DT35_XENCH
MLNFGNYSVYWQTYPSNPNGAQSNLRFESIYQSITSSSGSKHFFRYSCSSSCTPLTEVLTLAQPPSSFSTTTARDALFCLCPHNSLDCPSIEASSTSSTLPTSPNAVSIFTSRSNPFPIESSDTMATTSRLLLSWKSSATLAPPPCVKTSISSLATSSSMSDTFCGQLFLFPQLI